MPPAFRVQTRIPRPVEEVFDHVVEPELLNSYLTATASTPLEAGASVRWTWPGGESETVHVDAVERNRRVTLRWRAFKVETETRVEIAFEAEGDRATVVRVSESGWNADEAGLASSYEHCAGWQHMLMCLKARMVYGVDLRS